jgi:hypothetical protein
MGVVLLPKTISTEIAKMAKNVHWSLPGCENDGACELRHSEVGSFKGHRCSC